MTNNVSRCGLYQTDSYNVKSRWECVLPTSVIEENSNAVVPNLKEECEVGVFFHRSGCHWCLR